MQVPSIAHFLWIGSGIPAKYVKNINNFASHNSEYQVRDENNRQTEKKIADHNLSILNNTGDSLARLTENAWQAVWKSWSEACELCSSRRLASWGNLWTARRGWGQVGSAQVSGADKVCNSFEILPSDRFQIWRHLPWHWHCQYSTVGKSSQTKLCGLSPVSVFQHTEQYLWICKGPEKTL